MNRYDKGKHSKKKRRGVQCFAIFFLVVIISVLAYYTYQFYLGHQNKTIYHEIEVDLAELEDIGLEQLPANVRKVNLLNRRNSEVVGWVQIEDTMIDYPILQGKDNDYYLDHNYKNEQSKYGSIFVKKECVMENPNTNLIVYGHNMRDGQMFQNLLKYKEEKFYQKHPKIKIATKQEENNYQIISVFQSRVFYQNEENVFRYYDYTEFENESKYNEFIQNSQKIQLYDTGVSAKFGEQIVTLITCEYSQENGRFVIVAKKEE